MANVEPVEARAVPLVVWEVTEDCVKALDRYEGYPTLYTKKTVNVRMRDGSVCEVMIYVMTKRYEYMPEMPWISCYNGIREAYKSHKINVKTLKRALTETDAEFKRTYKVAK